MPLPPRFLERLLNLRLDVQEAQVHRYRKGIGAAEAVVPTPRILLILRGRIRYQIEDTEIILGRGAMLGVAARTRRAWRVESDGVCEVSWVTFESGLNDLWTQDYLIRPQCDVQLERKSIERLMDLDGVNLKSSRLVKEGELKAFLARFFGLAENESNATEQQSGSAERAIDRAIAYLCTNYDDPDVLTGLPKRVRLSPNYFRIVFRRRLGSSAQEYLTTLRMRAARSYLHETDLTVKEVAFRVGFNDALYFSKRYRTFWKRAPSKDRVFSP